MPLSIKRLNRAPSHSDVRARPLPKISMPVILQSSTNLQLDNMLDLQAAQKMMATRGSPDAAVPASSTSTGTEPDLTDGSSASSSPSIEHNHLSAYFPGPAAAAVKATEHAPALPKRVPSHSKREHERLARKRSLRGSGGVESSTLSPAQNPTDQPSMSGVQRTSFDLVGTHVSEPSVETPTPAKRRSPRMENTPFSPELGKLTESLEEQSKSTAFNQEDEDSIYMRKWGLVKFDATVYCSHIGSCYALSTSSLSKGPYEQHTAGWI